MLPRRPQRGELVLLLASVALFLLVAEGVARLTGAGDVGPTGYAPVWTRPGSPGARPLNSRGYRDKERTLAKPPGTRRIVLLGDSFAWGAGVHFEDALPQRLERLLNESGTETWEVINLARPGMNTVDQAPQLAAEGFKYDPDLVLLVFCLNDSEDRTVRSARMGQTARAAAEKKARKRAGLPRERPFMERFALYRFVSRRIQATIQNRHRIDGYRAAYTADAPGWIACRRALGAMVSRSRERGVPFVLVIFPLFANPLGEDYPFRDAHKTLAEAATAAGAQVVDLLPAYRSVRHELLVVNGARDEHPNEIAHRIAADYLFAKLENGIIPSAVSVRPPAAGGHVALAPSSDEVTGPAQRPSRQARHGVAPQADREPACAAPTGSPAGG
jgi:lysophospholipase L1-like esterase